MPEPKTNTAAGESLGLTSLHAAAIANKVQEYIYQNLISVTGIDRLRALHASVNAANKAGQSLLQDLGQEPNFGEGK